MLPNFLIIGAQKSGTTSLYRYLQAHPDVYMPRHKEPDFFVAERRWNNGLDWYQSLFADAGDARAIGEASTSYTMHPHYSGVPARIAATLPDVRLIYVLRNPIERARSDYLHYRYPPDSQSWDYFEPERRPIERALFENPLYLDTSRYAMQLEQYLEVLPRDRILLLTTEDLGSARRQTVHRAYEFLGLDPAKGPADFDEEHNRTTDLRVQRAAVRAARRVPGVSRVVRKLPRRIRMSLGYRQVDTSAGELSPELRERVADALRDDVRRLRGYMDEPFDGWGIA
jgi:hypothetical protein